MKLRSFATVAIVLLPSLAFAAGGGAGGGAGGAGGGAGAAGGASSGGSNGAASAGNGGAGNGNGNSGGASNSSGTSGTAGANSGAGNGNNSAGAANGNGANGNAMGGSGPGTDATERWAPITRRCRTGSRKKPRERSAAISRRRSFASTQATPRRLRGVVDCMSQNTPAARIAKTAPKAASVGA